MQKDKRIYEINGIDTFTKRLNDMNFDVNKEMISLQINYAKECDLSLDAQKIRGNDNKRKEIISQAKQMREKRKKMADGHIQKHEF